MMQRSSSAGSAQPRAPRRLRRAAPVQVLAQANVGPYATVQLHSTDSSALDAWLAQNGYNIPAAVQPILDAYVKEGSDFLAMKLLPNQGVQAMRPVRVTTAGAGLSLPLRMASIGTGAVTGITIWVVADGRYEPQNFPFFHIDDSQLVWDWSSNLSNYTTLRVQKESALKNAGWEIESSIALNEQSRQERHHERRPVLRKRPGLEPPVSATQDYLPIGSADAGAGASDAGYESADQVRDDDINTLFAGLSGSTVRVTRIRSDIAQTAMTTDFVLQASADQSELSNVRTITQSVNLTCPIYNGCNVIGTGTLAQAQASVDGGAAERVVRRRSGARYGRRPEPEWRGRVRLDVDGQHACRRRKQRLRHLARRAQGSGVAFGALAGMLGLVVGRVIRARRRRARRNG